MRLWLTGSRSSLIWQRTCCFLCTIQKKSPDQQLLKVHNGLNTVLLSLPVTLLWPAVNSSTVLSSWGWGAWGGGLGGVGGGWAGWLSDELRWLSYTPTPKDRLEHPQYGSLQSRFPRTRHSITCVASCTETHLPSPFTQTFLVGYPRAGTTRFPLVAYLGPGPSPTTCNIYLISSFIYITE